jgi:hypothetical protein
MSNGKIAMKIYWAGAIVSEAERDWMRTLNEPIEQNSGLMMSQHSPGEHFGEFAPSSLVDVG